ncbi:MAG TPA: phosphate ABC transporter substrate-binding protein PstS [Nocardioidaceae bacterium]|nr:phosphate ABC transporter substrate-binding protein PstS [Nocardioidaceae bacterium]
MKRTSFRRVAAPGAAALALGLTLSACGAANEQQATNSSATVEGLSGTLNGGGASSQEAAQNAWRAGFQQANPEVTVNYDPIGSGGGREQFVSGGFAFAGSDSYLDNDEGELDKATERCGEAPIEVPAYVSPIAVIYNLEGVDNLQLSPETLAGIFAGDIKKWNDPAIAEDNPDADLPAETINPVHRSDESGTTGNFTNYLGTAAPDAWTYGEIEVWPKKAGGEGGSGTSGVVSAVKSSVNSIGYADASQAGDLGVASVGVGDEFVDPNPEAAAKIFEVSPRVEGRADTSMVYDLDYDTEESGVYPIVLTSYLMACPSYDDKASADLVKAYIDYVISDEGQQTSAENAGSAPLSESVRSEAQSLVDQIQAG